MNSGKTILTNIMQDFVANQVKSGTYVNSDEVIRAGVRLLMEKDGAKQFYNLKNELFNTVNDVEAGNFEVFDATKYEPKAF